MQKPLEIQKRDVPMHQPTYRPTWQGVESRVCDQKVNRPMDQWTIQHSGLWSHVHLNKNVVFFVYKSNLIGKEL